MSRKQKKQPPPPAPTIGDRRFDWLWALLLFAATFLAYAHVWHAGYIWDDDVYITTNPLLTAPDGLRKIWFSLESPSQYFPLVYTIFRWEHALWGLNPLGYHLVNVVIHSLNALLVWWLLRLLRVPGAWLAAALFALHPVQVESVAWVTELKNVLMGFFFLLALICWTRFAAADGKGRWRLYGYALLCYALALFSKTTACTLPAALLLILWWRRQPITRARVAQVTPFVVMGAALGLVSVWWERFHQGTRGPLFSVGLPERVLVASHAVWFYLGKLIWPVDLSFSYPRWPVSAADLSSYVWVLMLIGAVGGVWYLRRWVGRGLEVGLVFFVATLSPVLGFIMLYTFRYSWVADHYQYLACLGPLALIAAVLSIAWEKAGKLRPLVAFGCAALLFSLGAKTWGQTRIYANEGTLWRATSATNPDSWMAQNNLAIVLVKSGETEKAIAHYQRALALSPDYAEAHYNLGDAYVRLGRLQDAREEYRRALELFPRFAAAHANLGNLFLQEGRAVEAREQFEAALQIGPRETAVRERLVTAELKSGDLDSAIAALNDALKIDQEDATAQGRLGTLFAQTGETKKALPHLAEAARLKPDSVPAHNNLANALAQDGRLEEAVAEYGKALALRPNDIGAHRNLARVLHDLGRNGEAEVQREIAEQLAAGLTK